MATVTIVGTFAVNLGANQATSISFTLPTGIQDGDLGAFIIGTNSTSDTVGTPPAGWTVSADSPQIAGTADESWLYTKTLTAAESGTTVTISGMTTSGRLQVVGLVARGTLDNEVASSDSASNTAITFSPITPVANDCLVVHLAYNRYASGSVPAVTPPPGFTEFADQASTNTSKPVFASWGGYKQLVGQAGVTQPSDTATANTGCYGTKYTFTVAPPAGPTTNNGAATGSVAFSGSGTGSASHSGSGTGSVAFTGSGSGSVTHSGTASGTAVYTGSATGVQPPTAGAATGSVAFTGSATGVKPLITRSGAATGSVAFTGSAAGTAPVLAPNSGQATGSGSFTGAGTGSISHSGSATGTGSFSTSATGSRSSDGQATGSATFAGSATGSAPVVGAHAGSATGAVSFTSTATGTAPIVGQNQGAATGSAHFTGSATGSVAHDGQATGSAAFSESATGSVAHDGQATGSAAFSESATGARTSNGQATGSVAFGTSASGTAPVVGASGGHATGSVHFTGTAAGSVGHGGAATGSASLSGTASGTSPVVPAHSGQATGSASWTGTAIGEQIPTGQASGSCDFTGTAAGARLAAGAATGVFEVTGSGTAPDTRINVTILSVVPIERTYAIDLQFRDTSVSPVLRQTQVVVEERVTDVTSVCRTIGVVPEEADMKFPVVSRQFYRLTITTDPAVTAAWQASFDGGTTWVTGTDDGSGQWSWLLETPSVLDGDTGASGATTLTVGAGETTRPLLRSDNGAELIVSEVPDDCVIEWV